jgi:PTS system N-acetylglucosamine-specific IIC component
VLNRLLIVTGLHHVLNNVVWFIVGDYHGATGDLNRFFAGDPTAGSFMAGFFPVMMFGLPAACLAMFTTARPERRAAVGGMLASLALTSFLTGVTEPIEFTFIFLAPVLYAVHAVLTGAAMVIMDALHVKLGFGFSAGLFDYALNFNKATRPLLLLPVGLVYFALYFGLFRFFIVRFDLKTPGREDDETVVAPPPLGDNARAGAFVEALGGSANLVSVDACTTRLRIVVADQGKVDDAGLRRLGARGLVRPSPRDLQVVLGPMADQVARDINDRLAGARRPAEAPAAQPPVAAAPRGATDAAGLLAALGGGGNVREVASGSSRLRIAVASADRVDDAAMRALGVRGVVKPTPASVQIVIGPAAETVAEDLKALLPH